MDNSDKALIEFGKGASGVLLFYVSVLVVPRLIPNKKAGIAVAIIGAIGGISLLMSGVRNFPKRIPSAGI